MLLLLLLLEEGSLVGAPGAEPKKKHLFLKILVFVIIVRGLKKETGCCKKQRSCLNIFAYVTCKIVADFLCSTKMGEIKVKERVPAICKNGVRHNFNNYRHGQLNPDSHSNMRVRNRLPMYVLQSVIFKKTRGKFGK